MSDLTYMKNFIKFLTITLYHKFNTRKDYFKHLVIEYSLAIDDTQLGYLGYLNVGYENELGATIITVEYNKFLLKLLSLSAFKKRKKEIFDTTDYIYLLSLKDEHLIPYKVYKIKRVLLNDIFSLQADKDIVYAIKLDNICLVINDYFSSLIRYFMDKKTTITEVFQLLDSLFQIADTYFNLFKDIHLITNYLFLVNYKKFDNYSELDCFQQLNLDNESQSMVKLINEFITKTMIIRSYNKAFELDFKIKHNKTFEDLLQELGLLHEYIKYNGDFTFKNFKKFNLQDFIIYLSILTNLLSI